MKCSRTYTRRKAGFQDLSLLPPCRDTLNLRSKRCNYVAKVWKSSLQATIEFDVITANGWSEEGKVIWMNEAFPPDVTEILMDTEEDSDLDETLDGESDSDYDTDYPKEDPDVNISDSDIAMYEMIFADSVGVDLVDLYYVTMAKRISKDNEAAVKEIDKSVSNKFRWDWLDKTVKLTIKTSKGSEEVTEKIGDFIAKIDVPVNWFDCLLLNYSSYPPEYLELIDKLLEYHDEHLHSHVVACNVSIKDFLNLLLDTAFYTVVNNDDWLKCWDHILSNHPSYLLSVLIAFITESKSRLMSFSKREHFLEYFSDKTEMDINSVIKEAYRFHKSTPSHVHARNIYPHFRPFPTDYVLSYMMGDAIPEHQEVNSIHKSMLSSVKQKLKEESHNEKYKISVHEQRLKALHDEYLENEKELQKLSICNPIVEALQHDLIQLKPTKILMY
ncbi:TBC1 domain family member 31 [Nymphon striatum]|nr:TBC1 domain family member 31 [Nymphon striatum]